MKKCFNFQDRSVACRPVPRQWPINSNRGMVFYVRSMPMAAHATMEICHATTQQQRNGIFCAVCDEILPMNSQRS
jgi:hypothetical protein